MAATVYSLPRPARRCEACAFWAREPFVPSVIGECRRYAPREMMENGYRRFPMTDEVDVCGEFSCAESAAEAELPAVCPLCCLDLIKQKRARQSGICVDCQLKHGGEVRS